MSVFYKKDALSVWTNLGKHFEVRLVMRLNYKDGHKTPYASRTNYLVCLSRRITKLRLVRPTNNASCARLYN